MIKKRIEQLIKKFNQYDIDGYIVPKNDEFFSEYAVIDRLKTISNFSGSAGLAVISTKKNYLFDSYKMLRAGSKLLKWNPMRLIFQDNNLQ